MFDAVLWYKACRRDMKVREHSLPPGIDLLSNTIVGFVSEETSPLNHDAAMSENRKRYFSMHKRKRIYSRLV